MEKVDAISNAGLERPLLNETNPYVIKSPWFADLLLEALENQCIEIYAALIPIRDLFEAAESRRRVHFEAAARGLHPETQPGGLWYTADPAAQEPILSDAILPHHLFIGQIRYKDDLTRISTIGSRWGLYF